MKKRVFFLLLILVFAAALRLYRLGSIPPSLYSDEANQLYNAYSVLTTGKDEHGKFLPFSFRSFGDWKPPLQTYLMVPFVWLWGPSEVAARAPSAVLGVGSIVITFLLVLELSFGKRFRHKLALFSAFALSISPWHVLESRAAMLVVVALFFYIIGVYFFIYGLRRNAVFLVLSLPMFVFSTYSYYGMRLVVPLTILFFATLRRRDIFFHLRLIGLSAIFASFLLLPLGISFLKEPDVVLGRARTVSVFYDQGIKLRRWELSTSDAFKTPLWLTSLLHNNYYLYEKDIARRFFSHLELEFLFVNGDRAQPFQIPGIGVLLATDALLLPVGLYWLIRNFGRWKLVLGLWAITIVPAALTFLTPASNRSFNASVPMAIVSAGGLYAIINFTLKEFPRLRSGQAWLHPPAGGFSLPPSRWVSTLIISFAILICFAYFLRQYFHVLPTQHADWWNWGWKEAFAYLKTVDGKYDSIVVYDRGMPYIYMALYQEKPPEYLMQNSVRTYHPDQFGYEHVDSLGKYLFNHELDWSSVRENMLPRSLYVIPADLAQEDRGYSHLITYPDGKPAIKFFKNEY